MPNPPTPHRRPDTRAYSLRQQTVANHPRHKAVLELAANAAGWGSPLPKGKGRGIAVAAGDTFLLATVPGPHERAGSCYLGLIVISTAASGPRSLRSSA